MNALAHSSPPDVETTTYFLFLRRVGSPARKMKTRKKNGKVILTLEETDPKGIYEMDLRMQGSILDVDEFEVSPDDDKYMCKDGILYSKDGRTLVAVPPNMSGLISIPDGVERILSEAFHSSAAKKVVIPGSVKHVEPYTFRDCVYLEEVELNEGIKSIESNAFYDCEKLDRVTIPGSVCEIKRGGFDGAPLRNLRFAESDEANVLTIEELNLNCCRAECLEFPNRFIRLLSVNLWEVMTVKIPYTKIGLLQIPDVINSAIRNTNTENASRIHEYKEMRYDTFRLRIGDEVLFFPKVMTFRKKEYLLDQVKNICGCGRFSSLFGPKIHDMKDAKGVEKRVEKLWKLSFQMYSCGMADDAKNTAMELYREVQKNKKRYKKEEQQLADYLRNHAEDIIHALAVEYKDIERLKEFLDLGLAGKEALKHGLEEVGNVEDDSTTAKAYLLEALGESETQNEENVFCL